MRKLYYMGLESYEARYTLQLTEWNRRVFERRGLDVVYVPGSTIDNTQAISVGQVLDAHGRSYFAMSQMMNLVQLMKNGEVTGEDVIYFEDMFQPGFESLGYIMNQIPREQVPRIYVRCLAQAIDPDDFVHVWAWLDGWISMKKWSMKWCLSLVGQFLLPTKKWSLTCELQAGLLPSITYLDWHSERAKSWNASAAVKKLHRLAIVQEGSASRLVLIKRSSRASLWTSLKCMASLPQSPVSLQYSQAVHSEATIQSTLKEHGGWKRKGSSRSMIT